MAAQIVHATTGFIQQVAQHSKLPSDFGELSNTQIDSVFGQRIFHGRYGGCMSKDQIPHDISDRFFVLNMANHNVSGTHWVLLYNCKPHEVIYFDSYGVEPPRQVVEAMHRTGKHKAYNSVDFQQLDSNECGWWCIYVALQLLRGFDFQQIVDNKYFKKREGDHSEYNRGILKSWFRCNGFIHSKR